MATMNVAEARRQIMRWQQGLRFARTEEERQLKAANVKLLDADEKAGLWDPCQFVFCLCRALSDSTTQDV
jgi:hypothetical protein